MNTGDVDSYLEDGCGRCKHYQTPECKVHQWAEGLRALREVVRATELEEQLKWGSPCYSLEGQNVAMIGAYRDNFVLSLLKGAALPDPAKILEKPGPNTRYARVVRFRSVDEVVERRDALAQLLHEALVFERSGKEVEVDADDALPAELEERLEADADFKEAFEALTPGRQRSYQIYIGGAKKRETREARVERAVPKIMEGKGWNER
ncbi:YdeI/OmpD-associated family protein [Lujinxingia vulgaris]|uniref:YdeI/OmpD-associated family protein n=1 Tax=Lujinxingia vulgaris TaxID=2600176 RepID=UPI001E3F63CD|nr:YdeI/OmpD-associated family protein [Lujinxingia vulgaris]